METKDGYFLVKEIHPETGFVMDMKILKSLIRNEILNRIKNSTEQIVFVDAALLYETNLDKIVDEVWCVALDDDIQLDRLMKRDNIDKSDALNRIDSQGSNESKIKKADNT